MRIAALYDIHGNLPALEAVFSELERAAPDLVVLGGDIASGPLPRETLDLVTTLGDRLRALRGNADRVLVEHGDGGSGDDRHMSLWAARRVTPEQRDFLAGLPPILTLEVTRLGPTLFCHGSPRSDDEVLIESTSEGRLREALAGVTEPLVISGHTHMQYDRLAAGTRIVNPGSVGMPYGEAGAHWALLGPQVELRRAPYDLVAAAERIRASGWPGAEEFARENVLATPSRAEALAYFEGLAASSS